MEKIKADQIVEHVRQIWTANPLPADTAELAVTTIAGIEQQLAAGSKSVHYLVLENDQLHIKLIKVTE